MGGGGLQCGWLRGRDAEDIHADSSLVMPWILCESQGGKIKQIDQLVNWSTCNCLNWDSKCDDHFIHISAAIYIIYSTCIFYFLWVGLR